jgi:hypothetical protein
LKRNQPSRLKNVGSLNGKGRSQAPLALALPLLPFVAAIPAPVLDFMWVNSAYLRAAKPARRGRVFTTPFQGEEPAVHNRAAYSAWTNRGAARELREIRPYHVTDRR